MKNQAEVHALLIKIAEAFDRLAAVIGEDDVPDDWEARGEPNPYIFDPLSTKADFVTPRSWRYAYCPPPTPTLDEWMEGADLSVPAGKYEPRKATPVVMLDEWMTPADREALARAQKLLHPLLETKRPRKNKNR